MSPITVATAGGCSRRTGWRSGWRRRPEPGCSASRRGKHKYKGQPLLVVLAMAIHRFGANMRPRCMDGECHRPGGSGFRCTGAGTMGKLSGTILILAGVALAASTFSFSRNPTVANVATPQVRGDAKTAAGPATPAPQGAEAKPAQAEESAAPPPAPPQAKPAPVAPAADTPPPAKPVEPRVTPAGKVIQPPAVRLAETPPRMPVDQAKPAGPPPLAGEGLARELQRHLKRAGCYGGAVTGVWSPPVRRAMKAFTDRANAALPVDQPDQVLLALVESNPQVKDRKSVV